MKKQQQKLSLDERMKDVRSQYRKLTNILQTIKALQRASDLGNVELEAAAQQLRIAREECKSKLKLAEMREEVKVS